MIKIRYRRLKILGKWLLGLGVMAAMSFPIIIYPMINPEPFKDIQRIGRKDLVQKDIQPGNMRIWRDPFDRKKEKDAEDGKKGIFFKGF